MLCLSGPLASKTPSLWMLCLSGPLADGQLPHGGDGTWLRAWSCCSRRSVRQPYWSSLISCHWVLRGVAPRPYWAKGATGPQLDATWPAPPASPPAAAAGRAGSSMGPWIRSSRDPPCSSPPLHPPVSAATAGGGRWPSRIQHGGVDPFQPRPAACPRLDPHSRLVRMNSLIRRWLSRRRILRMNSLIRR